MSLPDFFYHKVHKELSDFVSFVKNFVVLHALRGEKNS